MQTWLKQLDKRGGSIPTLQVEKATCGKARISLSTVEKEFAVVGLETVARGHGKLGVGGLAVGEAQGVALVHRGALGILRKSEGAANG